jgi:hypothetical protein
MRECSKQIIIFADYYLLESNAVCSGRHLLALWKNLLPQSSE